MRFVIVLSIIKLLIYRFKEENKNIVFLKGFWKCEGGFQLLSIFLITDEYKMDFYF